MLLTSLLIFAGLNYASGVVSSDANFFTVNPQQDLIVSEGDNVTLYCDVRDRTGISFSWWIAFDDLSKPDEPVVDSPRRYQKNRDLIIQSVRRSSDSHWFYCKAVNTDTRNGIESTSAKLDIMWISDYADVILRRPRDVAIIIGTDVTLKCDAEGSPELEYIWYKNKVRIFEVKGYRLSDNRLRFTANPREHNGVYSCEVQNSAGRAVSGESYLLNIHPTGPNSARLKDEVFRKTTVTVRDTDVWLDCEFENAVSTQWYLGPQSAELITNNTRTRTTVYNNGTLMISRVKKSDEGTYFCEGIGADSISQTFTAELRIAKLGRLTESHLDPSQDLSKPMVVAEGDTIEVTCLKPSGIPSPSVRWQNPSGQQILSGSSVFVEGTKLILENVTPEHTSNYTCLAENLAGSRRITLQVVVTVPPRITQDNVDTTPEIREGLSGQIHCPYEGSPPPWTYITWLFDNEPIADNLYDEQKLFLDQTTGSLTFQKAEVEFEGQYTCIVTTQKQTPVVSQAINLNIIKKLKFKPEPRSMTFEVGSAESITCHAEAEIAPVVQWLRLDSETQAIDTFPEGVSAEDEVLRFSNIANTSAGQYTCVAQIAQGVSLTPPSVELINATITISVGVSPTITSAPKDMTIRLGDSAMIHCAAKGDPVPNIKWDRYGDILDTSNGSYYQQFDNGSLYLESVNQNDEGPYGCIVGNIRGFKRASMQLTIQSNATFAAPKEQEKLGITKTIIIAVCSAVGYLALVIGLIVYCSIRLMRKKRTLQIAKKTNLQLHPTASAPDQELPPLETDRLMTTAVPVSNGNGHVMYAPRPTSSPVIVESRAVSGSQKSYRSNASSTSGKSGSSGEITRYDRNLLLNIGTLGHGQFGEVFLAKAPGLIPHRDEQLVCVKPLQNREETIQLEFRQEVEMYHKLNHERICRLLALCREREPIYMILEYCEWGDLKQFLLATSRDNGQQLAIDPPDVSQKINMCHQIAVAMDYLSSCRFIHRDIASRNILLEPNLNIKLTSLSLSKDIYASEYIQTKTGLLVPLRWTSPEAWLEDDYSTKSDVWSFACFLYEVFSGADIPFSDRTNDQVITSYESGDITPSAGSDMPQQLQTIAYQCWSTCPRDRPDFSQILTMFTSIHSPAHLDNATSPV